MAKWKVITHSMSKTNDHLILVGYKTKGKYMNEVLALAPLYNLNDANLDGEVSMLEYAFGKNVYDPYSVFKLMNSGNKISCMMDTANQMKDRELHQQAKSQMLQAAYKAAARALITLTIERVLSPGFERTLALTKLAEIGRHSDKLIFMVKTGLETVLDELIAGSQGIRK